MKVYDDFAHHPTAMRSHGRRPAPQGRPGARERILAVFEPRSNTMKLGTMKAQLPWALEEADLSFCLQGDYGWSVREALAPLGAQARGGRQRRRAGGRRRAGRAAGRPCAVHEQRRLRRHPRQAARRPEGARPVTPSHLLYLHGFRSSPQSFKAQRLQAWLAAHRPEVHWWCPQLPPSPREAMALVQRRHRRLAGGDARPCSAARSAASTPPWWPRPPAGRRCC